MKYSTLFLKLTVLLLFSLILTRSYLFAVLLREDEMSRSNYTAVHVWNNMMRGGRNAGHAAIQIVENNSSILEVSLHPAKHSLAMAVRPVEPEYRPISQDGNADHIVRLYSLNRQTMKAECPNQKRKYILTGNGGDSPFGDDTDSRNCSSIVRDMLNDGGMKELFEPLSNKIWSAPRVLPGAAGQLVGVGLGIFGGCSGLTYGFLKGVFTWSNPFSKARRHGWEIAKVCSDIPYDFGSRQFSMINYGHPAGESVIVTPRDILNLANGARKIEKAKFPSIKTWE